MSQPTELPNTSAADSLAARPTWVRWQIVALMVSFSFMTWFNRKSMEVAYVDRIKDQFATPAGELGQQPAQGQPGISEEAIGYVYSAFLFTYMLCMTPGGWLIDRFGAWAALVVMGLGSALLGALTGLAGHPALIAAGLVLPALLVIRSIMGIFTAPVYPAASRLVSHWLPFRQRAWANGLVQGAAALGIACAFPVFGALIDRYDWPTAFVITGGSTALLALLWTLYATNYPSQHRLVNFAERRLIEDMRGLPPLPKETETAEILKAEAPPAVRAEAAPAGWWFLLGNRSLVLLTVAYATVGYVEYLFFFWMGYYFKHVLRFETNETRGYSVILFLAMAAGMVLGGWLSDRLQAAYGYRWGRAAVPIAGSVLGAGLLCAGILAEGTVWIVTLLALALAAVGACEAPIWTTAVELGGRRGGTAAGICNTGGNAGGLLAPIVTPLVSNWVSARFELDAKSGWQWGISLGCLIGLLGAGLWWWIDPCERLEA